MNIIFKITAIALTGGIISVLLRQYRQEFSVLTGLCTAVVILFYTTDIITQTIKPLEEIISASGVDKEYFITVIRVIGISYLTQTASELLRDSGESAIAMKTELAGKIFILSLTVPIMSSFLEVCQKVLNGI